MHCLVYFEEHANMVEAIVREKQLKKWPRARKIARIENFNPDWRELYWEVSGLIDPEKIERLL